MGLNATEVSNASDMRVGRLLIRKGRQQVASIFRPVYTILDPSTGKRNRRKSPRWWIRYYTPDGARHRVKGYTDKKATEAFAAQLERRGLREDAGVFEPADVHATIPLTTHLADYVRYLDAKGNTDKHVSLTRTRAQACLDGCQFVRIADLRASAVVEFLSRLRTDTAEGAGKSVKTANEYLAATKGLTRWMWRDRRIGVDPLACLSKLANGTADIRHARRDYSPDELRWLLDITRQSVRPFRRLGGLDRYAIYLTAAATGFRTSELASMTPASFDLHCETPTATVQAACTKNRREAVQPLPLGVAVILRDYLRDKPADKPVWAGTWANDASAKMIRRDLADARKAWLAEAKDARIRAEREKSNFLAYHDSEGRYADFHGLRHTFITMVGKVGVSPKEHQDLARHSTYALTGRYTHSRFYDLAAAVQALPIPTTGPTALQAETLTATGTDDHPSRAESPARILVPFLAPQTANSCDLGRQSENLAGLAGEQKTRCAG
jgi:integrase